MFNQSIFEAYKLVYPQVTTSNVSRDGTMLQEAIDKDKENFVRTLLEFGLDHSLIEYYNLLFCQG